ncbi:MAG: ABC transporter ATP-binding protein [Alphaproteobacteria bacterium]
MIAVRDLNVRFGRGRMAVHAVKDVGFDVPRGRSFGLVGESGSGKSTVLRAIAGLNPRWTGEISIDGEPQGPRRASSFYKSLQMVFQDPFGSLHPRHTIDHSLAEPLKIHRIRDREQRVVSALKDVGLGPDFRFRYPHQLSGGQRQRVAIARAMILEPAVLLLDEPTSALDVSVQAEVLNLLAALRARHNLTFVLVSHNLAVVAHMCERIAVMNRGRIVEILEQADLRAGRARTPYTQQLLTASRGYDREAARRLVEIHAA